MHRLAANRVVDAGELQGRTAKDINTLAGASYALSSFCFPFPCTPPNPLRVVGASSDISIDVTEITFVAPTAGYLLINASTSLSCSNGNLLFICGDPNGTVYITVDGENYLRFKGSLQHRLVRLGRVADGFRVQHRLCRGSRFRQAIDDFSMFKSCDRCGWNTEF